MNTGRLLNKRGKVFLIVAVATILLVIAGLTATNLAEARGAASCDGTYIVDLPTSKALWTFSKDGTFQGTDSAEPDVAFSHQQGAWWLAWASNIKATWLDFKYDSTTNALMGYGRVDAEITFGSGCDTLTGSLDFRLYEPEEDPLDTTGVPIDIENVLFSGRRINP